MTIIGVLQCFKLTSLKKQLAPKKFVAQDKNISVCRKTYGDVLLYRDCFFEYVGVTVQTLRHSV